MRPQTPFWLFLALGARKGGRNAVELNAVEVDPVEVNAVEQGKNQHCHSAFLC